MFTSHSPVKRETTTQQVGKALNEGWLEGGSFISSLLAGTLLGYGVDWWLDTAPWFVIIGTLLGAYSGFMRVWEYSKKLDEDIRER